MSIDDERQCAETFYQHFDRSYPLHQWPDESGTLDELLIPDDDPDANPGDEPDTDQYCPDCGRVFAFCECFRDEEES